MDKEAYDRFLNGLDGAQFARHVISRNRRDLGARILARGVLTEARRRAAERRQRVRVRFARAIRNYQMRRTRFDRARAYRLSRMAPRMFRR